MKKAILIFSGLGLLGYGLYRYFKAQSQILSDFDWSISSFKVVDVSFEQIVLELNFLFTSKADLEARIEKLYLEIFMEGKNVAIITEIKPFVIPAHGSSNVPITAIISPKTILTNIMQFILDISKASDVDIEIKGYADIKSGIIKTVLPITYKTSLKKYMAEAKENKLKKLQNK